ncbi:hypothetical protein WA158_006825 [Blastocystis sp. Blastoise]
MPSPKKRKQSVSDEIPQLEDVKPKTLNKEEILKQFDQSNHEFPILCRSKEIEELRNFFMNAMTNYHGDSIYISGTPGTGKTLCLNSMLDKLDEELDDASIHTNIIWINAMGILKPQDIYSQIANKLSDKKIQNARAQEWLDDYFINEETVKNRKRKRYSEFTILCIDEIDRLLAIQNKEFLYHLFELPHLHNSYLLLVAISNSIDLVETQLPLLGTSLYIKPKTIVFESYKKQDLINIVNQRVTLCDPYIPEGFTLFNTQAIDMCCRKAEQMGDARKVLDICKRALEINLTRDPPTMVSLGDISKVLRSFFGSSTNDFLNELPIRVQELLGVLCGMSQSIESIVTPKMRAKQKLTITAVKKVYTKVMNAVVTITRTSLSDFNMLIEQLINNSIIKKSGSKLIKDTDVLTLQLTTNDIIDSFTYNPQLQSILSKTKTFF